MKTANMILNTAKSYCQRMGGLTNLISRKNDLCGNNLFWWVKRIGFIVLLVGVFGNSVFGAARTASVTGNWSSTTTWGGAAVPALADNVTINAGVTVTVDVASVCNSITFAAAATASNTLTISGANTLSVTGLVSMPRPSTGFLCTINVNAGSLSCGSLTMAATTTTRNDIINISTGTLTVSGTITTGTTGCQFIFTGAGLFKVGGSFTNTPALTTVTGSTVNYYAAGPQTVLATIYNNLTLSGSGAKTTTGVTVNGILSREGTASVTVVPNYGTGATLQYKGSALQTTGVEFPTTFGGTGGVIINNSNGVNLGSAATITNGLMLTSGLFAIGANTLTLNGPAIAGTPANLSSTAASSLVFGGTSTGINIPSSITAINNLTINNANGVALNAGVTVNGTLTLTNGNLTIGNNDLTIVNPVSGTFNNTHMIVTSGTGSLVKQGSTNASFAMVYPVGTGTSYTPMQIGSFTPTGITVPGSIKVRTVASAAVGVPGVNPLNRYWVTSSSNFTAPVVADVRFSYVAGDVNASAAASDYDIYYKPTAGVWSNPGGMSATGANPVYASTATSIDATWSASVSNKRVFYSVMSGDWDNPQTWTLDPAGTQFDNPGNLTPTTSPTSSFDEVVVLSGRTVTVKVGNDNKANTALTVNGRLDFTTTTGHVFTTIHGTGVIRLAGDNFPAGDATDFITQGQGEGTVEFYGLTRSLNIARTFYSVLVNMDAGNVLSLLKNYNIGGDLTIQNGTFQINDNAATTGLTINVNGNLLVGTAGKLYTGTGNARHQLNLYGNLTNNGEVKFTNRAAPAVAAYYAAEATDGIVDVNFLNGTKDQSVLCNGLTNFYRIEIDKGTDDTYILNLDATSSSNFNLLGYANQDHGSIAQLTTNDNALGLIKGTVRIGNNISIPSLSTNNNYNISESAQLLVDGGFIAKSSGIAIVPYGKITVNSGTLESRINSGITLRNNGSLYVNGGVVNINQLRTSELGATNIGGFIQTDGEVNVLGGNTGTDFYVFCLTYTNSVFNMSGGILHIYTSNGKGSIFINSDPDNVKVTGGTVICETNNAGQNFVITSRAPFWNLQFRNTTTVARDFILDAGVDVSPTDVDLVAQPLVVLNDFRIWGKESGGASYPAISFKPVTASTNIIDVYVGGSFYIENGAQYVSILGGTTPYNSAATQPTYANTTHFNQTAGTSGIDTIYWGNTVNELELGNFELNRTHGYELRTASAAARVSESVVMDVNGKASVISGTFNQGSYTIRTWGSIVNMDRMGTWYSGITPSKAQIQFSDNAALTITTTSNAVFGNVQVNVTPPTKITLTSDVYIERMEYLKGLFYLKGYNLKVDDIWDMETGLFENTATSSYLKVANSSYSANSLIYTDGKASDGGLTLKIKANSLVENQPNMVNNAGPLTFPIGFTPDGGTNLYFRPAQMVVKGFSDDGYVTIRPVLGALQTTSLTGGEVLQNYWRVSHTGFTTLPKVAYRFYYRNQKTVANVDLSATAANEANYVPGKVLDESPYTRSNELLADNDIIKTIGAGVSRAITINGTSTAGAFSPSVTGITIENANYTAGVAARFSGSVYIYYTRDDQQQAPWENTATWTRNDLVDMAYSPHDSRQPAASAVPGAGDVAVIGWIPWTDTNRGAALQGQPHGVFLNDARQVAEVVFTKMTDATLAANPVARVYRSNFQFRPTLCVNAVGGLNGVLTAKLVKGEGEFWNRNSDPDYTIMDIGDFAREDSSYVIYENFTNNRIVTKTAPLFPNLYISNDGWGSNDEYFTFANNIVTTGNLELLGNLNLLLPNAATGDITVGRNLVMFESNSGGNNSGGGCMLLYPNSGTARKVVVAGDLKMNNTGGVIKVNTPGTTPLEHELHISGNIIENTTTGGGLQLWTGATQDRVTLFLDGANNMTFTNISGAVPNLYRLVVNKGTSLSSTAQFNNDFILNGPTSGAGVAKALQLKNGTFIYNNPNAARTLSLTTGNDNFDIPSTAGLEIRQGKVVANGASGIGLDGLLALSGGSLDMSGGDNFIEYSASGNANITVSAGTLTVGSQIRRSLTSNVGVLKYTQTGGIVIVGQASVPVSSRGVLEIINAGSSFDMSGGDLYIARSNGSSTMASFYLNPGSSNIGNAANIHIGSAATPASQVIGVYANTSLPNLRVNNTSGNKPTAQLQIVPSTISSLLLIDAGATFDANGLDLMVNGNMTNNGTFVPKGNTTYFSGTGASQTMSGITTFFNLTKTTSNNLLLNAGNTQLTISNNLTLQSGTFTDNNNTVNVKGDCQNDALHVNGGSGDGIALNGIQNQTLTGNGTFGKLTVNNSNGVTIPVGNQIKITRSLKMQNGIINIGKNLLDLGVNATIEQASPFSKTNMIQTNISFSDYGLRKVFPSGASGTPFIFPMGSTGKYTPVTFTITANGNSTGSITVKPANEYQPAVLDATNALQYYWTLKSSGMSGFSATAVMKFVSTDVNVTGANTIADYISARLLDDGTGNWNKPFGTVNTTNMELNFPFAGAADATISGDYTAGTNAAIPSTVPSYQTIVSGDWTSNPTQLWNPDISGGPRGAIARINAPHTVDVTQNYLSGYSTEIYGTLKLYTTYGHRLGIIKGNGLIYLEQGDLPAGDYGAFFSATGGTVEYGGTGSYDALGNIIDLNKLIFSGTGDKRLPNNDIHLFGSLTINGAAGLNVLNVNNKKITLEGNFTRTSGTFDAGSGAGAAVVFSGVLTQQIQGAFTGSNAFNILQINNSNGLNLVNDIEINQQLRLTNGLINPNGNTLRIKYNADASPVTGTSTSFVNGTLTKELMNGNSFTFPIGDNNGNLGSMAIASINGTVGIQDWKATYHYANATLAGFDADAFIAPVSKVAKTEYWDIQGPAGASSTISLKLDGSSDVALAVSNINSLRVVGWNSSTSRWDVVGGAAAVTGTATAGSVTTTSLVSYNNYRYFTLASVTPIVAGTATITNSDFNLCSGSTADINVALAGTAPWTIFYNDGSNTFSVTGIYASPYKITVSPTVTTTYTLTSVTAGGLPGSLVGNIDTKVTVNPVPTVLLNVACPGTGNTLTFSASTGLSNYDFRVNGTSTQNGASNTYTAVLGDGNSVDVKATNASNCSATSSALVNQLPYKAGTITGSMSVCFGSSGVNYTVPAITNATGYIWTIPSGASITAGNNTNSITVNFGTAVAGNYNITVKGTNSCGYGVVSPNFPVSVSSSPTPGAASTITGVASVCRGGSSVFTVPAITNATSYVWMYSATGATNHADGGVINATGVSTTGASITIDFSATAVAGNLTVKGIGCGSGATSPVLAMTVNAAPTATAGSLVNPVCEGQTLGLTGAGTGTGILSYSWTGPASYASTTQNPSITSVATTYTGTYTLTVKDGNNCTQTATTDVIVNAKPVSYAGADIAACTGTSAISMTGATASGSYSGTPAWTGTGGSWVVNPDPALATFTPATTSGSITATLTLTGTSGCSNASATRLISWGVIPSAPGAISGTAAQCPALTSQVYSVTAVADASTYTWTVPSGWIITAGAGSASITVTTGAAGQGGNVTVTAGSSCGTSAASTLAVTVNAATAISSQSTATQTQCIGGTFAPITVTATGAGLTYQWYRNTTASTAGGTSLLAANGAQTNSYTPQASATGTLYYYCIVGGACGSATSAVSGAFVVLGTNTEVLSSAVGTDAQTLCIQTAITNITYTTTVATGIGAATGLPAGVTAAWAANTITISGTPTASGTFNYSIPLSGGCGTVSATGTITCQPLPATGPLYRKPNN